MAALSHSDRVRAGMAQARVQGKHMGRPRKDIGILGEALEGYLTGKLSQYKAAKLANIPRSTFRRRLIEWGELPGDSSSQ
jgi:DNA invertase Pin-like site-specific DNA recombinase